MVRYAKILEKEIRNCYSIPSGNNFVDDCPGDK